MQEYAADGTELLQRSLLVTSRIGSWAIITYNAINLVHVLIFKLKDGFNAMNAWFACAQFLRRNSSKRVVLLYGSAVYYQTGYSCISGDIFATQNHLRGNRSVLFFGLNETSGLPKQIGRTRSGFLQTYLKQFTGVESGFVCIGLSTLSNKVATVFFTPG